MSRISYISPETWIFMVSSKPSCMLVLRRARNDLCSSHAHRFSDSLFSNV